jgi:hypothetical protein
MAEYADAGIPFYWLAWLSDDHVLSIDIHVLDHTLGNYRLQETPAGPLAHLRSSAWFSPTAALIRARWVNAWGKLPSASPELPICSANSPRWLL